ncbi:hypothetical protein PLICRDRAFT_452598 [Plicaturopsis crispa FD-325 SS-3]|uniref:F-box domain-containing protein n=1 Tax=Plicaturopsis crispa FD-325 SS-3 TaxID=944288 RepID=A0A0C9T5M8_PLICR|nr:hypothetical protein PLICRDRAFT_452598 [Plicaturopsis crispa FD-325 SS-3]
MEPDSAPAQDAATFYSLPSELIVMILEIAAASSTPTALALCLVSSWARKLARPHLLDTVVLATYDQRDAFEHAVLPALDCADTLALVRHLWVAPSEGLDDALGQLTGLTDLAISPSYLSYTTCGKGDRDDPDDTPAPENSRVLRLTLLPSPYTGPHLERLYSWEVWNPALLVRTTHLSFVLHADNVSINVAIFWAWNLLNRFPRLTHLAVALPTAPCEYLEDFELVCAEILKHPSMQTLVLGVTASARASYPDGGTVYFASLREKFPRVCIVDVDGSPEVLSAHTLTTQEWDPCKVSAESWLAEIRTGDSIWQRAIRQEPLLEKRNTFI